MKTSESMHKEITVGLSSLPKPSDDPKGKDLAGKLAAAEAQAQRDVGELGEAQRAEGEAADLYSTAVGDGDERHVANATKALEGAAARVAVVRSRLLATGRLVDRLREEHSVAVAAATVVVTGPAWAEARRALETSAQDLESAARRVRGQLSELEALARGITSTPRPLLRAVRFTGTFRPDFGHTGGGAVFNPGEVAGFLPDEAAVIVAKRAAVYIDPWRGLGDARA